MDKKVIVGLDIGTTKVCTIVGLTCSNSDLEIIGIGTHPSHGLTKGSVVSINKTVHSIRHSLEEARLMSGVDIDAVAIGIAGSHIYSFNSCGVVAVRNQEIEQADIDRAIEAAKAVIVPSNREIIHVIPQEFKVDNTSGIKNPLGMCGVRLEVSVHIVTGSISLIQNLVKCVELAGVRAEHISLQPIASSMAVLSPEEKEIGVVLVDIGGGTTDLAVWYRGALIHTQVIPVGGNHFTNDLAIALKAPHPEAEVIKINHGAVLSEKINQSAYITVNGLHGTRPREVRVSLVTKALGARGEELFSLVKDSLRDRDLDIKVAGGFILTGGGASLTGLAELGEYILERPVKIGHPIPFGGMTNIMQNPKYSTVLGLVLEEAGRQSAADKGTFKEGRQGDFIGKFSDSIKSVFRENILSIGGFMFDIAKDEREFDKGACIKVMGIGGGGCNAVNTMIKSGLSGVEYIVANTDAQALNANLAPIKVQLGAEITKGLGAGANPEIGRKAALDEYEKLSEVLEGADMVFITAGMGGGTGTGAAPVIAKLCKDLDILTVGVVTKPFLFEGKKRFRQAEAGIINLEENVDSLIAIPNQRLLYIAGESLSLVDTFKKADEVLLNAVRGISDLINNTGHINADFSDVSTVMANKGLSLMGTGFASGPERAIKAATEAISSPLLEDVSINGATGIIINITGSSDLTMRETDEAATLISEAADKEAEIILGTVIDEEMKEEIKITVIATGLGLEAQEEEQDSAPPVERVSEEVEAKDKVKIDESKSEISTSLIGSIKEAAKSFNAVNQSSKAPISPPKEVLGNSSDKSIAEKLGFINFDEEELDTPTFMRKEDGEKDQATF